MYQGLEEGTAVYRLSSMVCFTSKHYMALVQRPDTGAWLLLEDAEVSHIGSWAEVRSKCEERRLQPNVLFFEKYDSAPSWQPLPMSPSQASAAGLVPEGWQSQGPQRVVPAEMESFKQQILVEPFSVVSLAASAPEPPLVRHCSLTIASRDASIKGASDNNAPCTSQQSC